MGGLAEPQTTERPAPSEASSLPVLAAKADDLEAIRAAVVDGAGVSAGLWLSYLFVLFYLLIAVGAVTHRDLFLANPIKLPFLGVELPLGGFFWLGPLLFLIVHAYVLLHFALLSSKVGVFHAQLQAQIDDADARTKLRRQLPINIFVQFLAGPQEVRRGLMGVLLRLIAWISLVIGPVALLAFFELQFLPYHGTWITMWQRIAVVLDLFLLWLLWPAVVHGETPRRGWRNVGWAAGSALACVSLASVVLVFAIATFPGEWLETKLAWFPLRQALVAGEVDDIARKPTSLRSNRLVLPRFDVIDHAKFDTDAKIDAAPETAALRGRHLEGAVLTNAILRKVDLAGAHLDRADLLGAHLGGADLSHADLSDAGLIFAHLDGANLDRAHLLGAHLGGANLRFAHLDRAELVGAHLDGAQLVGAHLDGAQLVRAHLDGAKNLTQAQLDQACGTDAKLPEGLTLKPCQEKEKKPAVSPPTGD